MPQGGRRTGAGRPKGARSAKTLAQTKAVEASGLTPLDFMLSVMRDEKNEQAVRLDAANKAAPYVHAKLATVDHKSSDGSMATKPDTIVIKAAAGADGGD
ncbi:hypothetical protein IP68_12370 [Blastomonas sp. AAP25]|uniref:hypothetical protein n=1 Tax=Blastomonas sp. AAP25 TaxID=1523416 RepID=UPI0006CD6605|nr:hypothetical protein [Blastomonas sp. AAP25]KPF74555.1 hypothetical protein IP68_12370 [Blastomonas sp. AAP25]